MDLLNGGFGSPAVEERYGENVIPPGPAILKLVVDPHQLLIA